MHMRFVFPTKAVFFEFILAIAAAAVIIICARVTKAAFGAKEGCQKVIHPHRAVRVPTHGAGRLLLLLCLRDAKATYGALGIPQPNISPRDHGPKVNGTGSVVLSQRRRVFLPSRCCRQESRRHGIRNE
jgi:hypothetical protein